MGGVVDEIVDLIMDGDVYGGMVVCQSGCIGSVWMVASMVVLSSLGVLVTIISTSFYAYPHLSHYIRIFFNISTSVIIISASF